jgi:hypothetical protein
MKISIKFDNLLKKIDFYFKNKENFIIMKMIYLRKCYFIINLNIDNKVVSKYAYPKFKKKRSLLSN